MKTLSQIIEESFTEKMKEAAEGLGEHVIKKHNSEVEKNALQTGLYAAPLGGALFGGLGAAAGATLNGAAHLVGFDDFEVDPINAGIGVGALGAGLTGIAAYDDYYRKYAIKQNH